MQVGAVLIVYALVNRTIQSNPPKKMKTTLRLLIIIALYTVEGGLIPGLTEIVPQLINIGGTPTPAAPRSLEIVQSFSGSDFLSGFSFFNQPDPTNGAVNYVSADDAQALKLVYTTSSGSTILKVDNTSYLANGVHRNSVRITSNTPITVGSLLIMDAVNLPHGGSVWPAFWTLGSDWPKNGEIDIIEGANGQSLNRMSLHTKPGCTLSTPMAGSGTVLTTT